MPFGPRVFASTVMSAVSLIGPPLESATDATGAKVDGRHSALLAVYDS